MFLNAVILILQEILEAVMLISIMLVLGRGSGQAWPGLPRIDARWVLAALVLGLFGALAYGWAMPVVSTWFDYVGLEVMNALLQAGMIGCVLLFGYLPGARRLTQPEAMLRVCMVVVVALGIVREGSEIILYVQGILGQPENATPVALGALIAVGIGVSSGYLVFQGLCALPGSWPQRCALLLLGLFAGNMAAQAVLLLTQADWLPYTPQLWDSSTVLPEFSVTGQLLYALVGYEANPSLLQAGVYLGVFMLLLASPVFRGAWAPRAGEIQ